VAQVPVNVQVAQAARLVLDAAGRQEAPLVLTFRNCVPAGCFAELELRDQAALRRLRGRAADAAGRLEWRNAAGGEAGIPVSFRGFAAAYDALAKQAD
jgi:invasion protein IalB